MPDTSAFVYDNTSLAFQIHNQLLRCTPSPENISLHTNTGEVSKPRTIVPCGFEDSHALGNRCAGESLVVRGVNGRE